MELRQLRYFVAVAEEGNIVAASHRLFISQPPISRQIQALEEELGVKLFVRTRKGVELTAPGAVFLEEARKVLSQLRRASERSRAAGEGQFGQLDVAYFGSTIYQIVPPLLRSFRSEVPQAKVSLTRMDKQRQVDALREGAAHIGFARYYAHAPDIVVERMGEERISVAIPADERAPRSGMSLEGLRDRPIILFPQAGRPSFADDVVAIFRKRKIEPQVAHVAEDATSALTLTAIGAGACLVPRSVAAIAWPGVRFLPLTGTDATVPIHCAYKRGEPSPILKAFLTVLRREALAGDGVLGRRPRKKHTDSA